MIQKLCEHQCDTVRCLCQALVCHTVFPYITCHMSFVSVALNALKKKSIHQSLSLTGILSVSQAQHGIANRVVSMAL